MERTLRIDGLHNFRDMGGYPTVDGRIVRWGVLFRSGSMTVIDQGDVARLKALGIATICDLRTTKERHRRPTTWHAESAIEILSHDYEMSGAVLQDIVTATTTSGEQVHDLMIGLYRKLPAEQSINYRTLFRQLVAGRIPLVFNCSAGKDRTGVAAALVLSMLGVSRVDVEEDYLLTNEAIENLARILSNEPAYGKVVRDNPEIAYPLLRAERQYLKAMFDEIDRQHGSLHGYLNEALQISDADIEVVKAKLTC